MTLKRRTTHCDVACERKGEAKSLGKAGPRQKDIKGLEALEKTVLEEKRTRKARDFLGAAVENQAGKRLSRVCSAGGKREGKGRENTTGVCLQSPPILLHPEKCGMIRCGTRRSCPTMSWQSIRCDTRSGGLSHAHATVTPASPAHFLPSCVVASEGVIMGDRG